MSRYCFLAVRVLQAVASSVVTRTHALVAVLLVLGSLAGQASPSWIVQSSSDGIRVAFSRSAQSAADISIHWGRSGHSPSGSATGLVSLSSDDWADQQVPTRIADVFPGIDVSVHGLQGVPEFDFVVRPTAEPQQIAYHFGADAALFLQPDGSLLVEQAGSRFMQRRPVAYQDLDGERHLIPVRFRENNDGSIGFDVGSYRRDALLVIDPTVEFSSNIGPGEKSVFRPVQTAVAKDGSIFVLGIGNESSVPAMGNAYRPYSELATALVLLRVHPESYQILSRTFLPRPGLELVGQRLLLEVDANGAPWIATTVTQMAIPATGLPIGPVREWNSQSHYNILLLKLRPDASGVDYSTYIGCQQATQLSSMSAGSKGGLAISGHSSCRDFPTTSGSFQPKVVPDTTVYNRGVLLKLNTTTNQLEYATYFEPTQTFSSDLLIKMNATGGVVMTTASRQSGMPVAASSPPSTPDPSGSSNPGLYVAGLNADGSQLEFGRYFSGYQPRSVSPPELGQDNSIYLSGLAHSGFPVTAGAVNIEERYALVAFVVRARPDASQMHFSATVATTSAYPEVHHLGLLPNGDAVTVISDASVISPHTPDAFGLPQSHTSGVSYFSQVSAAGDSIRFASTLPISDTVTPTDLAITPSGRLLFMGTSRNVSALQTENSWENVPDITKAIAGNRGFFTALDFSSDTRCNYGLGISSNPLKGGRDTGTLSISTAAGCPWQLTDSMEILDVPRYTRGIGPKSLAFRTTPNVGFAQKTSELAVATASLTVRQDVAGCDFFELSPSEINLDSTGDLQWLDILTGSGCPWTMGASTAWFLSANDNGALLPGARNGGRQIGLYSTINSFGTRTGTIQLGNETLVVTQAGGGCSATLDRRQFSFGASGGAQALVLQTQGSNCAWQITPGPGLNFPNGLTGTASATVSVEMTPNPSNQGRQSYFYIANQLVTVTQAAGACSATISPSIAEIPYIGGYHTYAVTTTGPNCTWNASVNQSWAHLSQANTGSGSGTITVSVEPNLTGQPREAILTNLGAAATIRQLADDTSVYEINGPAGYPVKINGVSEVLPFKKSFAPGTVLRVEPDSHWMKDPVTILSATSWGDHVGFARTDVATAGLVYRTLLTRTLKRLAVETVPGGRVEINVSNATPSASFPGFYEFANASDILSYTATAIPAQNYHFLGWVDDTAQTYDTRIVRTSSDGLSPFLRPRFEQTTSNTYFLPATLSFPVYPYGDDTVHLVELRTAYPGLTASIGAITCTQPIQALSLLEVTQTSSGYRLRLRVNHSALRDAPKTQLSCSLRADILETNEWHTLTVTLGNHGASDQAPGMWAITNATNFASGPLAPGALSTIFGIQLATGTHHAPSIPLPKTLGGARIRLVSEVDQQVRWADLLYVSPLQINFHTPEDMPVGNARISHFVGDVIVSERIAEVNATAPGVFIVGIVTGGPAPAGNGLLVTSQGQQYREIYTCTTGTSCSFKKLDFGSNQDTLYLSLYGTGLRQLPRERLSVMVNGTVLPVEYLGRQSHFVGLDQMNLRVPRSLDGIGTATLEFLVDGVRMRSAKLFF